MYIILPCSTMISQVKPAQNDHKILINFLFIHKNKKKLKSFYTNNNNNMVHLFWISELRMNSLSFRYWVNQRMYWFYYDVFFYWITLFIFSYRAHDVYHKYWSNLNKLVIFLKINFITLVFLSGHFWNFSLPFR